MKFILLIFAKEILLRVNELLWPQKCCVLRIMDLLVRIFLWFCAIKGVKRHVNIKCFVSFLLVTDGLYFVMRVVFIAIIILEHQYVVLTLLYFFSTL